MFLKFFTLILSVLFFTESSHAATADTRLTPVTSSSAEPLSTAATSINYQGHDVSISAILSFGNQLIKGKTPASLNIAADVFKSIRDTLGYFNISLAHGNLNQITDLPVLERLLANLLLVSHKDVNILLDNVPAEDKPYVQGALTAAATIATASMNLAQGGKVTPSGVLNCCVGASVTIGQQLLAQQAAQNQPTS